MIYHLLQTISFIVLSICVIYEIQASNNLNLAQGMYEEELYDSALFLVHYDLSQQEAGDTPVETWLLAGKIFREKGDLDSAAFYFHLARRFAAKRDLYKVENESNINLGSVYGMEGQLGLSEEHFLEAFTKSELVDDSLNMAKSVFGLANIYYLQENYKSAIESLKIALDFFYQSGDQSSEVSVLLNLSDAYRLSNNPDSALVLIEKAITGFNQLQDTLSLAQSYHNKGLIMFSLSRFKEANEAYQKSLELSELSHSKLDIEKAWFGLSMSYGELAEYKKAFEFLNQYQKSHDAPDYEQLENLYNIKLTDIINTWSDKIALLNANVRLTYVAGVSLFLLITVFGIWFYKRHQAVKLILMKEHELANQKINDLLQQQEIRSLQGVLAGQEEERKRIAGDLHDKLGAILGMVKLHFSAVEDRVDDLREDNKKQYEKANELLDQANEEVRNISHNLVSGVLTKFGLAPALRDLRDKLESTGKLQVELQVNDMSQRLSGDQELQVYRIVQELVGNILKHAKATHATIQLNRHNGTLNLIVEDDGVGFDAETAKGKDGMGMRNLQARVDKLNGQLHYDSGKGRGTTVSIDIPLTNEQ